MDAIDSDVVVAYRGAEEGDLNFILNSWLKSYQGSRKTVRPDLYFTGHQRLIGALAEDTPLIICCDGKPGQSHFIYGYACGAMNVEKKTLTLHYIYVKAGYRTVGFGRELLKKIGWTPYSSIIATHWTPVCASLAQRYNVTFSDYPLMIGNQNV